MADTHSPAPRPQLAVSAAIFRDSRLLLVRRAVEPARGFYSLPGGRVEFGETLTQAVAREVREETALAIDVVGLAAFREVLPDASRGQNGHYVILSFAARWTAGEVQLNEELDDAQWRAPGAFADLPTTAGLAGVIDAAQGLIAALRPPS